MSGAVTAVMAVGAAVGAGASIYNGQQQKKAASKARKQAEQQAQQQASMAEKQQQQAEQEFNRANQKRVNSNALLDAAQQAGKSGLSGTMLTGAQGVDSGNLELGKSNLLGSNSLLGG